ncbi:MAG: adenylate kinase, partial [Ruminococcus sp.]|nr:adenylate kinase [Ruminococcus sp.]
IIEGCYIPFDWKNSFDADYLSQIKYICLVMSESYITSHFSDIVSFGNAIEKRLSNDLSIKDIIQDNQEYLRGCLSYGLDYFLINEEYDLERCCI